MDIDLIWGFRAFIRVFVVLVRIAIWEAIDGEGGVRGEYESEPLSFWLMVFFHVSLLNQYLKLISSTSNE